MATVWRILKDPHDAEDAFQDATLRIWTQWKKVRRHSNPPALVLRICINCAVDVLRKRKEVRRVSLEIENLANDSDGLDEELSRQEQRTRLLGAIGRLSRNQALVVLMRLVEKMPYADIAAAVGCQECTARVHYRRGREKLEAYLNHLPVVVKGLRNGE